jgi:TolB-like protein/Tfp pilus assembly protein PilF
VLPLENLCGDQSQNYLADGITEELTTDLAQVGALHVISRTSASRYKGTKKPLPQVGSELHVDGIIEGAVRCDAGHITVTTQLIDTQSDHHLWARSYPGDLSEIPAIQGQITRDIARALRVSLAPQEQARLSRSQPVKSKAYDYYLRAYPYFGLGTSKENEAAIQLLEKAVSTDPAFPLSYAALSTAYRVRAFSIHPEDPQWEEKATAAVEKALELDPQLAEAYVARGYLLWSPANHFASERAVQDYRHALALNPNLAEAHHQLSNIYNHVGLLDKAQDEVQQAVALDPLNTGVRFRVGVNYLYQGRYQESLEYVRDSERFNPPLWAFQTSYALFQLGQRAEAEKRVSDFLKQYPEDPGGILTSMQGLFAAAANDQISAERGIQAALAKGRTFQHFHHTAYIIGSAYALMNKPEPALKYLQSAAEDGFPCYPLFEHDPNLDHLRKDPRFIQFMAGVKKQWEHYAARI